MTFADGVEQAADLLLMVAAVKDTTSREGAAAEAMGAVYNDRIKAIVSIAPEALPAKYRTWPGFAHALGTVVGEISMLTGEQSYLAAALLSRLVDATGRDAADLLREVIDEARAADAAED